MRGFQILAILIAAFGLAACSGSNSPSSLPPGPALSNAGAAGAPQEHGLAKKASPAGTLSTLYVFSGHQDGANPQARWTKDAAGNFYGTTRQGGGNGYGNVYRLARSGSGWTVTPIYTFTGGADGANPQYRVVFGPDGSLTERRRVGE